MSNGQELLRTLKANATRAQPCLSIPVGSPVQAILRPVATDAANLNTNDVRVLTQWRNRFVKSFLTEFEATDSQTARWLSDVVGPDPTRILFMLDDTSGQTAGYLGVAFIDWKERTGEADAIVRGAPIAPGVMTRAMLALLGWSYNQLGLQNISVRVRSDNPALGFFLKIATEIRRVPLRPVHEVDMVRWVEDDTIADSSTSLVYLNFHKVSDWKLSNIR